MRIKAFIFLLLAASSCALSDKEKGNIKEMGEDMPVQEAFNVTYLYSDSAIIQGKLTAPHAIEKTENMVNYSIFDEGMRLEFFDHTGNTESVLTGNHGKVNMEKGLADITGNVVVINQKGERMETERLTWSKGEDKVYSDQFVKIITADEIVYGDSLEASPDFGKYRIYKIRGIINAKDMGQ